VIIHSSKCRKDFAEVDVALAGFEPVGVAQLDMGELVAAGDGAAIGPDSSMFMWYVSAAIRRAGDPISSMRLRRAGHGLPFKPDRSTPDLEDATVQIDVGPSELSHLAVT
jgi:hypothetical protein